MSSTVRRLWLCLLLAGCMTLPATGQQWKAPTSMKKLANGLIVVCVGRPFRTHVRPVQQLWHGIGFRLEPEGRTGFAHLFGT